MSNIPAKSTIGLAEFIHKLKNELSSVEQDDKIFVIDKAELEIQVTASRKMSADVSAEGKLELEINVVPLLPSLKVGEVSVEGDFSGENARQDVHTVKLSLTPAAFKPELLAILDSNEKKKLEENTKKLVYLGSEDPTSKDPI